MTRRVFLSLVLLDRGASSQQTMVVLQGHLDGLVQRDPYWPSRRLAEPAICKQEDRENSMLTHWPTPPSPGVYLHLLQTTHREWAAERCS